VFGLASSCGVHDHQSSPSVACREAMYSLMACQNEAAPGGPISASRLTALLSAASKARCAAGFNFTCSRSSLIRSSAVISLVASSSDDRDKNRNASKHVSRLINDLSSLVCCGHAPATLSGISAQWLGLGCQRPTCHGWHDGWLPPRHRSREPVQPWSLLDHTVPQFSCARQCPVRAVGQT